MGAAGFFSFRIQLQIAIQTRIRKRRIPKQWVRSFRYSQSLIRILVRLARVSDFLMQVAKVVQKATKLNTAIGTHCRLHQDPLEKVASGVKNVACVHWYTLSLCLLSSFDFFLYRSHFLCLVSIAAQGHLRCHTRARRVTVASGHTATNTPDLFRTPKLTVAGPR